MAHYHNHSTQLSDPGINVVGPLCINVNYGWGSAKNVSRDPGGVWMLWMLGGEWAGVLGEQITLVFTQG